MADRRAYLRYYVINGVIVGPDRDFDPPDPGTPFVLNIALLGDGRWLLT